MNLVEATNSPDEITVLTHRSGFTIVDGFIGLAAVQMYDWVDTVQPGPGDLELIPAKYALNLRTWHYATASNLYEWAEGGFYGRPSGGPRLTVVAAGSVYKGNALPLAVPLPGGSTRLATLSMPAEYNTAVARIEQLLLIEPNAMALCIRPKD